VWITQRDTFPSGESDRNLADPRERLRIANTAADAAQVEIDLVGSQPAAANSFLIGKQWIGIHVERMDDDEFDDSTKRRFAMIERFTDLARDEIGTRGRQPQTEVRDWRRRRRWLRREEVCCGS